LCFTYTGKRTKVPFTWGGRSFASERNILQKVEAVGITCYMVQLKDGITLTAKKKTTESLN
jgi:hypothetical protein